jgi:hypothetical protein
MWKGCRRQGRSLTKNTKWFRISSSDRGVFCEIGFRSDIVSALRTVARIASLEVLRVLAATK